MGALMSAISVRLRLLPVLIFLGSLFLTVKIGQICQAIGQPTPDSRLSVAEARAQQPHVGALPVPSDPAEAPQAAADEPEKNVSDGEPAPDRERQFSAAEVEVLSQLAKRRELLDARARELDKREGVLKAAEAAIDRKVEALKELQAKLESDIKAHDAEQDAKMASLAKLYETMKPKDAARIFEGLEMDTVLSVVERMKERKLAPILAGMEPAKARDVTMELIRLGKLDAETTGR
jgi:flagellar motility protein MotE (MotC chaperone)